MGITIWQTPVNAGEWSGYVSGEMRGFANSPADPRQDGNTLSLAAQPEYYHEWDDGRQSLTFTPFVRWDETDRKRSHADIRELTWLQVGDDWELRAGVRKVFWGVTESQHLVDIINQTDLVEALDGEEKLGQPMLNLALIRDWGTVDFFVLPGFRERTFAGKKGRLRFGKKGRLRFALPVDTGQTQYESSRKQQHVDYALRWSHYLGDWDLAVSYFNGTSRDPNFLPNVDSQGKPISLTPFYPQIEQLGLELQATLDAWLWKAEAISRSGQGNRPYTALTAGFEYTFVGIFDSQADLGVVSEILYDDRGKNALTPFADDILLAARFTLNDAQSSEALLGVIFDSDDSTRVVTLESSRRLGENWKLSIEAQSFLNVASNDFLYGLRRDNYVQLELARYF
ncbi:MAG: hypothetical protein GXP17_01855 [Gammaproteobacteria bacterium]|nr:hypothetical protein [Gammaproteobacteria bacterium]